MLKYLLQSWFELCFWQIIINKYLCHDCQDPHDALQSRTIKFVSSTHHEQIRLLIEWSCCHISQMNFVGDLTSAKMISSHLLLILFVYEMIRRWWLAYCQRTFLYDCKLVCSLYPYEGSNVSHWIPKSEFRLEQDELLAWSWKIHTDQRQTIQQHQYHLPLLLITQSFLFLIICSFCSQWLTIQHLFIVPKDGFNQK